MYYIYGISGPSLLIESTDSMIVNVKYVYLRCIVCILCILGVLCSFLAFFFLLSVHASLLPTK